MKILQRYIYSIGIKGGSKPPVGAKIKTNPMKTTARIIITDECPRKCKHCVNLNPNNPIPILIDNFIGLGSYKEIVITGGEPLIDKYRLGKILIDLRLMYPKAIIYLYSALPTKSIVEYLPYINGINFTIHEDINWSDAWDFEQMQDALMKQFKYIQLTKMSLRLHVFKKTSRAIPVVFPLWKRVKMVKWIRNCPIPEHEELFKLNKESYGTGKISI